MKHNEINYFQTLWKIQYEINFFRLHIVIEIRIIEYKEQNYKVEFE